VKRAGFRRATIGCFTSRPFDVKNIQNMKHRKYMQLISENVNSYKTPLPRKVFFFLSARVVQGNVFDISTERFRTKMRTVIFKAQIFYVLRSTLVQLPFVCPLPPSDAVQKQKHLFKRIFSVQYCHNLKNITPRET